MKINYFSRNLFKIMLILIVSEESVILNGTKLLAAVGSATLNSQEIQALIDVLLNRQGSEARSKDWNKVNIQLPILSFIKL